jgi:hypothetical protein
MAPICSIGKTLRQAIKPIAGCRVAPDVMIAHNNADLHIPPNMSVMLTGYRLQTERLVRTTVPGKDFKESLSTAVLLDYHGGYMKDSTK